MVYMVSYCMSTNIIILGKLGISLTVSCLHLARLHVFVLFVFKSTGRPDVVNGSLY